jgi:hypothetical protein
MPPAAQVILERSPRTTQKSVLAMRTRPCAPCAPARSFHAARAQPRRPRVAATSSCRAARDARDRGAARAAARDAHSRGRAHAARTADLCSTAVGASCCRSRRRLPVVAGLACHRLMRVRKKVPRRRPDRRPCRWHLRRPASVQSSSVSYSLSPQPATATSTHSTRGFVALRRVARFALAWVRPLCGSRPAAYLLAGSPGDLRGDLRTGVSLSV